MQNPELKARKARGDEEKQTEWYSTYDNLGLVLKALFLFCDVPYDKYEAIFLFEIGYHKVIADVSEPAHKLPRHQSTPSNSKWLPQSG